MQSLLLLCITFFGILHVTVAVPPAFEEGTVNGTITIGAVLSETKVLRCTVTILATDMKSLEMIPPSEDNKWEIIKNTTADKWWIEVEIHAVTEKNKQEFKCTAISQTDEEASLTYNIATIYAGTTFEEGATNATLNTDLTRGVKSQKIRCTIKSADPAITSLDIIPHPPIGNTDYRVIGDNNKWIGMEFDDIDDDVPSDFICIAVSNVTTAQLTYRLEFFDGIKFGEGDTNGTINNTLVMETTATIRCTIASADPPLAELLVEPMPLPGNDDYKVHKDGNNWIEIEFININDHTPDHFQCIAKNNLTLATLDYAMMIAKPVAPVFDLGGNDTFWTEIATGANRTLFCNVVPDTAIPPVSSLTALPFTNDNWVVDINGNSFIEIKITEADTKKNKRFYICVATNGVRSTTMSFQTYVGGPPTAVDVSLDSVIKGKNLEFSLSVTDHSSAPAQHIIIDIQGITNGNITLNTSMPDNYDDEIKYSFSKFYKTSLSSVRGNATVTVYASNTLGEVHVKDFSIAIPAEKSKTDGGKIAAGILVPFFLVLGAAIIGVVLYYFWRKHRKGSTGFTHIGGDDVDDATKSTYGAL